MKKYDLVIQLGSQVMYSPSEGRYSLAVHTAMRTQASAIVLKKRMAPYLMISGGSNFGVRYNDKEISKSPNFSFVAFAKASFWRKSEADVIRDFLVREHNIEPDRILTETSSSTTEENAEFAKIILQRKPMFNGNERIAILTLLYHMTDNRIDATGKVKPGALTTFRKVGLNVDPLFAENVLAYDNQERIESICKYYSTPKGGKHYDVERIRQLLTEGKSLEELM